MAVSSAQTSTLGLNLNKSVNFKRNFLFPRDSGTLTTSNLITHLDAANPDSYGLQNMLSISEDFDNAYWTKQGCSISANQTTSPTGTNTADLLVEDTSTGVHRAVVQFTFTAGRYYTCSVYAKANTGNRVSIGIGGLTGIGQPGSNRFVYVNLTNGSITSGPTGDSSASVQSVGNGWYRISITIKALRTLSDYFIVYNVQNNTNDTISYTGTGNSVYIWGAQLEESQNLGKYLATSGQAVLANTWKDLSGNFKDFVFQADPVNRFGYFEFDGRIDRASISHTASPFRQTSAITYEAFVRIPIGSGFNAGTSVGGGQGTGGISVSNSQAFFSWTPINPGSDRSIITNFSSSIANQWVQLCVTIDYSSSSYAWYLNGSALTTSTSGGWTTMTPSSSYAASIPDNIGGRYVNTKGYNKFDLAIFRVYNRALSAGEVANNFNYNKARFGL